MGGIPTVAIVDTNADPEIIVALPCGYDLAKTREEMVHLTSRPDWCTLRAVKTGRVYVTDSLLDRIIAEKEWPVFVPGGIVFENASPPSA